MKRGRLDAHVYRTVFGIEAILAVLKPGADSVEYVIDPTLIVQVEIVD